MILESTAQSREALAEMSRKQLESKIRELTKDLEYAKKERDSIAGQVIPESNDPFEQLEKLEAIKGRLKKYGFIDSKDEEEESEEPKEEKPKDFLGKIMHYGPQIVGPILQRVDAATAVAQQAVAQQQAQEALKSKEQMIEQQRMIAQEQEAAAHREMALRERREMLLQRRIEREQENEVLAQRQEMAQHFEAVRASAEENPQVEDVQEVDFTPQNAVVEDYSETHIYEEQEVTEMSETEGYGKIADYLAESVAKKKSASAMINEIRMAKMMGMFSQDMLTSFLSREFDGLVTELSALQPSLRSPKARITLKSVMEGLKK